VPTFVYVLAMVNVALGVWSGFQERYDKGAYYVSFAALLTLLALHSG